MALYVILASPLINIFLESSSGTAMDTGVTFLRIVSPFYFVLSLKLVADGVLRGSGLMKKFVIATFTDLFLRVICAFVFSSLWGVIGIWCSWPVGWVIATVLSVVFYKTTKYGKVKSSV